MPDEFDAEYERFKKSNMSIRMKMAADIKACSLGKDTLKSIEAIAFLVDKGYWFNSEICEWVKE
jgi:hypothetical protein